MLACGPMAIRLSDGSRNWRVRQCQKGAIAAAEIVAAAVEALPSGGPVNDWWGFQSEDFASTTYDGRGGDDTLDLSAVNEGFTST